MLTHGWMELLILIVLPWPFVIIMFGGHMLLFCDYYVFSCMKEIVDELVG